MNKQVAERLRAVMKEFENMEDEERALSACLYHVLGCYVSGRIYLLAEELHERTLSEISVIEEEMRMQKK